MRACVVLVFACHFAVLGCDEPSEGDPDAGSGTDGGEVIGDDAGPAGDVDAGPGSDAGPPDPVPSGTVPVFLLQGHLGRTALSCDDGRTWVAEQAADTVQCWGDSGPDCDHDPNAGRGLAYGDGYFYRTLGWGPPGGVERSTNGVDWTRTLDMTTFAGLAFDGEVLIAGSRSPRRSTDLGQSWMDTGDTDFTEWNVRSTGWAPYHGGRFFLIADGPEINLSTDGGQTWRDPMSPPTECSGDIGYGNDLVVTVNRDGVACRSSDGGESWQVAQIADSVDANVVFRDGLFYVWARGMVYTSPDAETWTGQETSPANLRIGVVAVSEVTGTFAAVEGGWTQWYDEQSAYRSEDGVTWQTLDASSFTGGHPVRDMVFGYAEPSAECPLP